MHGGSIGVAHDWKIELEGFRNQIAFAPNQSSLRHRTQKMCSVFVSPKVGHRNLDAAGNCRKSNFRKGRDDPSIVDINRSRESHQLTASDEP